MNPTLRKPFGVLLILFGLTLYAGLVLAFAGWIGRLSALAQAPIYLVLGILWIMPLKPLLLWMETGHWRVAKSAPKP